MSPTMHPPYKTRRIPDHALFLGGFAALAVVAAFAFQSRPAAQRPATVQRAPVQKAVVDTSTSRHWILGIREAGPNEATPVVTTQSATAPSAPDVVVAEAPQA